MRTMSEPPTNSPVRVRFAPSPTGYLHLGGARTALFNWLFARHHGGAFVLRVEDTDAARNTEEAIGAILEGLRWLGLDWDEGPFFQSERNDLYATQLAKLEKAGLAYQDDQGVTKFRVPDKDITVNDAVCGDVTTNLAEQGSRRWDPELGKEVEANPDISIRRADGTFLFHFVNVVDDIEMGITHVFRGEDHLPNTPKHIALFEALGATPPAFAHVPLILTKEGKKLSKRDAGSGLTTYVEEGYLSEAVLNYLALLGWSPKDDREKLEVDEIVSLFGFDGLNRSNARFDLEKCAWLSGQYLAALSPDEFTKRSLPFLTKAGIDVADTAYAAKVIPLIQEKVRLLSEVPGWVDYFFTDDFPTDSAATEKAFGKEGASGLLAATAEKLAGVDDWNAEATKGAINALAAEKGVKLGAIMPSLRVALSGRLAGPGVFETLEVLGREKSLSRMRTALESHPA